jgi:pimeloyl-ACP methyl ester carboxylesterase
MTPFVVDVAASELADLRDRLTRTRWPQRWPDTSWEAGTDPDELRGLVDYWLGGYDWRAQEAAINAFDHQLVEIGGSPVHFVRFEGEVPGAMPIVLTNGWPSSFLELTGLAQRLASPSRYGGVAGDAFTVIVPSLPGFTFSPQRRMLPQDLPTHQLWHQLMHDVLGFERYGAHGGDLGAGITSRLGAAHPDSVIGIHLTAVGVPSSVDEATLTAAERNFLAAGTRWRAEEGAYQHQQQTRPVSLGYGLSDSPVGLLAWMVEKYRAWSDCDGDLSSRFSADFLLTQASLYWFTNTISTSFRPYYEHGRQLRPTLDQVSVPTAIALFPADLSQPPRSWAERIYNVTRYTTLPRGGHFAAHEEPELLARDLTEFFGPLR